MNKRTMTRVEKLEGKAPERHGRSFRMIVREDDPAAEQQIEAFRRDHGITDADKLIVRRIVKPPMRQA